jgi:parallel beta-helix repeat protein
VSGDIELEIGAGAVADTYVVRVVRAAAGGEPESTLQLDVDELLSRRDLMEATLLASAVPRRSVPAAEQPVREVGQQLFQAVFTGPVNGMYRASLMVAHQQGRRLRVVLRLTAPKLAALPWETLFDPETGSYLCRQEPLVRHVPAPYTPDPLPVRLPLRILGLVASPRGLAPLDVEAEQDRLAEALAEPTAEGLVEVVWVPQATWAAVHARLLSGEWHVLHFVGHGDYDTGTGEGVLALVGPDGRADLVEAGRIADLLGEAQPTPRLVVLNSCSSGQTGAQDLFSGTAAALARSGISAVAAMQFAVSDTAAIAFARGFYTAITHGRSVDEAARSGRISMLGTPRSLEWVTPVLYVRGEARQLFTLGPPSTAGPPRAQADRQASDEQAGFESVQPVRPPKPSDVSADPGWTAALEAFYAGRWEQAAEGFEALQGRYPDDLRVQDRLQAARRARDLASWSADADAAAMRGDWARAVEALERITAVDGTYQDATTRLERAQAEQRRQSLVDEITALHRARRWKAVIAAGDQLHQLDPTKPDPRGMLADARRQLADEDFAGRYAEGLRLLDAGDREPAATVFAAIEQERPGYRDATALLASAGGSPPTRVVAPSGGHHTTIAAAIAASAAGDQILIKPGEYRESLTIDKTLQIHGDGPIEEITLQSADTRAICLRAGGSQISNLTIRRTVTQDTQPEADDSTGAVQIEGGQPTVRDCDISSQAGCGIVVQGDADPVIRGNHIHDNKEDGVHVLEQGRGTVEDNDISANTNDGVQVQAGADPVVRGNRIHDNQEAGVYVFEQGRGTFEDNDISANTICGIQVADGADPVVRGNRIYDNQGAGVHVLKQGRGTFEDNDISANPYGVLVQSGGDPLVHANRIHDNQKAGVYVFEQGRGTFEDNDISANTRSGITVKSGTPAILNNRIHKNRSGGVVVSWGGGGTIISNNIFSNTPSNLKISSWANATQSGNRTSDYPGN